MFPLRLLNLALGCAFGLAACDARPGAVEKRPESITYAVQGVVTEVRADRRKVVVAHQAIPGYMAAMTMEFDAPQAGELDGLRRGDEVTFRLTVTDQQSWIDRVKKIGTAPIPPARDSAAAAAPALLPDCSLVDSSGRSFHLNDFRGRALALTFIFTRCPLPDFCPRLNTHFATAQHTLSATDDWRLLSISLDPEYDIPARLAQYASRYAPDPARWTFATGARDEIEKLGAVFGLQVARTGALPDHNLRTVVVDPTGRVRRIFSGNEWTAEELVAELQQAMVP